MHLLQPASGWGVAAVLVAAVVLATLATLNIQPKAPGTHAGLIVVAVVCAGALWYQVWAPNTYQSLNGASLSECEVFGSIAAEPRLYPDGHAELVVAVDSVLFRNRVAAVGGKCLVRVGNADSASITAIPSGSYITVPGTLSFPAGPVNPGGWDYGAYLRAHGIGMILRCTRGADIYVVDAARPNLPERGVFYIRNAARKFARTHVRGEEGELILAMLIGERAGISDDTRENFARTGTLHILAVSGLHAGIIALALFVLVSWIRNRWARFTLYTSVLGLYAVVAGGAPSVVRAVVMAIVYMAIYSVGRINRPLNTLAVAALVLLLLNPLSLFDVGFQLSFAAVTGIILFYIPVYRYLCKRFPIITRRVLLSLPLRLLLVSVAAQLFTLPFTLYHFGYVGVSGILLNMAVVPLASCAVGAGVVGVIATLLPGIEFVATWFGGVAHLAILLTQLLVNAFAVYPWAGFSVGTMWPLVPIVMCAGLLWGAFSSTAMQAVRRAVVSAVAVLLLSLASSMADPLSGDGHTRCYLLASSTGLVAVQREDTLFCYGVWWRPSDSVIVGRTMENLRKRVGADTVIFVDTGLEKWGLGRMNHGSVLSYNGRLLDAPVLLTRKYGERTRIVQNGSTALLVVNVTERRRRATVLQYDTTWQEIPWR